MVRDPEPRNSHMITVANRASPTAPKPLTQEQQENAMTSEGARPAGQMPEPAPEPPQPVLPVTRRTKGPFHAQPDKPDARKA
jgi:hypothetical protein